MSRLGGTDVHGTVMASDGILLMGLSLVVTILGTQAYYRIRGQPINNAVAGLVIGMCTGALVFSEVWWHLFGIVSHRAIQLDSQVCAFIGDSGAPIDSACMCALWHSVSETSACTNVLQVFYNLLIPPIVFYAGFSVKKKLFFKNLVTIAIFGILGSNLTGGLLRMSNLSAPRFPASSLPHPTFSMYHFKLIRVGNLTVPHSISDPFESVLQLGFFQQASTRFSRRLTSSL